MMENRTGAALGVVSGFINFIAMNSLIDAVITAFICGLAGAAATHFYNSFLKKYLTKLIKKIKNE